MVELSSYHGKNDKTDDSRRAIRGPMDRFVTNIGGGEEPNTKMTGAKQKRLRNNMNGTNSTWARSYDGKAVNKIIHNDHHFWPSVSYALKTTNPLFVVLRLVDSEQMPTMRFIYRAMDNAKEHIAKNLGNKEALYKEI
ncbi:hAT dimerization domain-containing protein/transposase-related [Abeliophyllum distichum]|uniref:HAT dimerization domain-containing protein/transposase-related n=1 Tax=Abeliophyllum distichum TaxID=126358 RepID=A0ABD1S2J4_9LAMI